MWIIKMISSGVMPVMVLGIIGYGVFKGINVFEAFLEGAKDGMKMVVKILPALIGLIAAITMFRVSGALDFINTLLSPVTKLLGIPAEVMPLALLRPVSGSGALAIVSDILKTHGADSLVGRITSVMMGSSETTFYTLAVYFGAVSIKDSRYALKAALTGDVVVTLVSVWVCIYLFV